MKVFVIAAAVALIVSCFFSWVIIPGKNISIGGLYSGISNYGKPGLFHIFLSSAYILFVLLGRPWSIRTAFFIAGFNIAWALRNFIVLSTCSGGVCPEKQPALYVVLASSFVLLVLTLFLSDGNVKKSLSNDD